MAVTQTDRLGLTRWSSGLDAFTRTQMDDSHANLEARAAGFLEGTAAARPAASALVARYVYYARDTGVTSVCVDTDGAGTYAWVGVGDVRALPDGTAAAPALAFGSDPDTGLLLSSVGTLGLVAGGTTVAEAGLTSGAGGAGGFRPGADAGIDLGLSNRRWRDLHLSGAATIGGRTTLKTYRETIVSYGTVSSGTVNVDLDAGSMFVVTASGNISVAFPNSGNGAAWYLRIYTTAVRAITWPAGLRWPGNTAPPIEVGNNLFSFVYEGGVVWGSKVGTFT